MARHLWLSNDNDARFYVNRDRWLLCLDSKSARMLQVYGGLIIAPLSFLLRAKCARLSSLEVTNTSLSYTGPLGQARDYSF